MRREESARWFERARRVIAGGVNSPARSFVAVGGGPPVVMARGEGPFLIDVDGQRYIDYLAAFGPLILGHSHPRVVAAIEAALKRAPLFGTPAPAEIALAEALVEAVPGLEQVRMTTTGTEAVMAVIRLARAATGRNKIVKFEGTYHGHSDAVLVRAGSGPSTIGRPDSGGIPPGVRQDVITVPFNQPAVLAETLERVGREVAVVLVEPVAGNMGIVLPNPGYLAQVVELAHAAGALVAFDEVITAFRFHYGPAASLFGVRPDLYVLGKAIGGGLALAAYGGSRSLMALVAPEGPVFQAGTLAGNPLAASAGLATLAVLREENPYPRMDRLAAELADGLRDRARAHGVAVTINRLGSAFTVFFGAEPVVDYASARRTSASRFARFHRLMLERGVYLAPSPFEAWFVSAQHGEAEVEATLGAAEEAFAALAREGKG
ncbi:MAG: glutamate-1-semialdehyde 2,1-aminomutase [Firmicutes bacterium]|nr:glutamate-1-semialdehyde 2,1-aminomutase [Alicyclobacillaceae bacterium]MCL6497207.1 glutamate-1-semialdehyde 2,1-aminomutase [Bacillota bacterium]